MINDNNRDRDNETTESQKCHCLMCSAVHGADVGYGYFIDFTFKRTTMKYI